MVKIKSEVDIKSKMPVDIEIFKDEAFQVEEVLFAPSLFSTDIQPKNTLIGDKEAENSGELF